MKRSIDGPLIFDIVIYSLLTVRIGCKLPKNHSLTRFVICVHDSLNSAHLKYVNENIFLRLLGAADVLQDDRVVDALGIRLVQVIGVGLVPLLEGKEDLVLVRAHYLHILKEWRKETEGESGVEME